MIGVIQQGGIGNVCFQIGAALSYSLKHNMELVVSKENVNPHLDRPATIFPNLKYSDTLPDLPKYIEPTFTYTEIPYIKDLILCGYFQSFKYIEPYREQVLKAFGFDDLPTNYDWVSVHIRRSDYLKYPTKHPVVTLDYIKQAASKIKGDYCFQIHSDDPQWCEDNLTNEIFDDREFEIEEQRDELSQHIQDLQEIGAAHPNLPDEYQEQLTREIAFKSLQLATLDITILNTPEYQTRDQSGRK